MLLCWTFPREICCCLYLWICAVLTLTCPTELPCCAVFLEKYAVAYIREFVLSWLSPWGVQLNFLFLTRAERIDEWTPMCLHYSLDSWRKSEQVLPKDHFHLRDSSKSFSIHTIPPLFLSCEYWHHIILLSAH